MSSRKEMKLRGTLLIPTIRGDGDGLDRPPDYRQR